MAPSQLVKGPRERKRQRVTGPDENLKSFASDIREHVRVVVKGARKSWKLAKMGANVICHAGSLETVTDT